MNVFGLVVTHNEAGRYLECALSHLAPHVDGIAVFDDQSSDGTVALCEQFSSWVDVRGDDVAPFAVHEGRFRRAAWQHLERSAHPTPGDWVLSVDADEVLVCNERPAVHHLAAAAKAAGAAGATVAIPEAFSLDPLAVRTDRMWAGQRVARLVEWRPDARFPYQAAEERDLRRGALNPDVQRRRDALAGGSAPLYGLVVPFEADPAAVQLLHLGYADPADRDARYRRYRGRRGHNPAHIDSIIAPPTLEQWAGDPPDVWRGARPAA